MTASTDTTTPDTIPEIVRQAIENGAAALLPDEIGDKGRVTLLPPGWQMMVTNVEEFERMPRSIRAAQKLVGIDSLGRYVEPFATDATRAYMRDVYGSGLDMLTRDTDLVTVVLDDHLPGAPSRTEHRAIFVLRPTAAAKRWGDALRADRLTQEAFLDLVVDGVSEIAEPDAAVLRDLVENLHAIRSTEVSSVMRTGGQGAIELKENVGLSTGSSNRVPFPESLTVVLTPFAGMVRQITMPVKVSPVVLGQSVLFTLSAPSLDDALASVASDICGEVAERTGLTPMWTP